MNLLDLYDAQKPMSYFLGNGNVKEEASFTSLFRSSTQEIAERLVKEFGEEGTQKLTRELGTEGVENLGRKIIKEGSGAFIQETSERLVKEFGPEAVERITKELGPEGLEKLGRSLLLNSGDSVTTVLRKSTSLTDEALKFGRATMGIVPRAPPLPNVSTVAKASAEETIQKGASATGKAADSLIDNVKVVGKSTTKNAWESFKNMGKRLGKGAKAASEEMIDFARKHPYMTVGGVTIIVLLAVAADRFNKMNGKEFPIISVKKKGPNFMEIVFSSDTNLVEEDSIEILSCDAEPSLVGKTFIIEDVENTRTIIIKSDLKLTKDGTTGMFRYTTDFGSSFKATTKETIKGATGTFKEGIKELTGAIGDIGGAAVGGFWEGLGLPSFGSISSIISIVGIFFLLSSLFLVYRNLTK